MINCHVHLFTIRAVPERFFGFSWVMKLLMSTRGKKLLVWVLNGLSRITGTRRFERLAAFAGVGSHKDQQEIFDILQGYYPSNAEFVVLPMDFSFMKAGISRQPYLDQLGELRQLKRDPIVGPRIHPFVAIDPRREGFLDLAREYITHHGFAGIKIYPALGFFPFDDRLSPLWEWAEALQIPIMSHASRGGVHFKGKAQDIQWPPSTTPDFQTMGTASAWTDQFSNPLAFGKVLRRFPRLKICLAHMGGGQECDDWLSDPWPNHLGESNWLTAILGLIKEYENVFTDVSYTGFDTDLHALIHVLVRDKTIGTRILFGSDFYMVHQDANEREFSIRLKSLLSEEEFNRISEVNPRRYLNRA